MMVIELARVRVVQKSKICELAFFLLARSCLEFLYLHQCAMANADITGGMPV